MVDGQVDAFVFNVLVLRYLASTEFPGRVRVLPTTFDRYKTKMGMPAGSTLREPLNRALLAIVGRSEWRESPGEALHRLRPLNVHAAAPASRALWVLALFFVSITRARAR